MPPDHYLQAEALVQARLDIAMHKAEIAELRGDIAELKQAFATQAQLLQQVLTTLSEARGGWRTLMLVGGAGTTLGGVIAWALEHLTGKHP
jgi:hypothetical protein